MNFSNKLTLLVCAIVFAGANAFAAVTVNSPAAGTVSSPFTLSAYASTCSSQNISAMGYSLDNSTATTIVSSSSIDTSVSAAVGGHTLHVKAWGEKGAVCVTDVAITVAVTSAVPSDAVSVSSIQALSWTAQHDTGTGGSSSGDISIVSSPSQSGAARDFYTMSSDYGGERYMATFGDDTTSMNFLYDGYVYLASPSNANIANIEMDVNQTMANGQTAIFGFQCDGWSQTWDYTANKGTADAPNDQWVHTGAGCNPRSWSANTWHHVRIQYSRTAAGEVTYNYVSLDGVQQTIGATVLDAYALGWAPILSTNFQVDSDTAGSSTSLVYLDELTVYRW